MIKMTFIKSAMNPQDFPLADLPEVALVGRSNAGKSSFLNALAQQKIAKVSGVPGKTRTLNFFTAGDHYRFVDMPGYGFAGRNKQEQKSWQKVIEGYLLHRECLVGLLLIMDMRRKWTADEQLIADLAIQLNLPLFLILNKQDKLNRQEQNRQLASLENESKKSVKKIFLVSCLKKMGMKEVEEELFATWVKPRKENI